MQIENLCNKYYEFIGEPNQAISIKAADFLYRFVKENDIKTVLDLGSGLSTAVFAKAGCKVTSVDDTPSFLKLTKKFLTKNKLKVDLISLSKLELGGQYDLVFYDLGDFSTRIRYIKLPLKMSKRFAIYDDMNNEVYREILESLNVAWKDIAETTDITQRFLAVIGKSNE